MTNLEKQTIKNLYLKKFGFVSEETLNSQLELAAKHKMPFEEIVAFIDNFDSSLKDKPISSNLLSDILVSQIFNTTLSDKKSGEYFYDSNLSGSYKYLPKLGKLVGKIITQDMDKLHQEMYEKHSGMYNFVSDFEGDITLKNKLDFEVLRNLNDNKEIKLKDLQLSLYNGDVLVKQLLLNEDKLILQTNSKFMSNDNVALAYLQSYGLVKALSTKAFSQTPEKIKGISLINNNSNMSFDVFNYSFDELKSPYYEKDFTLLAGKSNASLKVRPNDEDYTKLLFSEDFPRILKSVYKSYNAFLVRQFGYSLNKPKLEKEDINTRLEKDKGMSIASKDASNISPSKDFEYYKEFNTTGEELSPEEKRFKFIDKPTLSPSQLNSYLWNRKSTNVGDTSTNEFIAMVKTVVAKYGLALSKAHVETLKNILEGKEVSKEDISLPLEKTSFSKEALTRMNFGNQVEEVILNHYQNLHPELGIKIDKGTLHSKTYDTTFDIDGYIGVNLNNISQVVEIKNSTSEEYFKTPEKIIDSYRLQLAYYDKLLKPKNGIKFIVALSKGKETKFFSKDVKISKELEEEFERLYNKSKTIFSFLIHNNLFDFNNIVNSLKQKRYFEAKGISKKFDIKEDFFKKNDKFLKR